MSHMHELGEMDYSFQKKGEQAHMGMLSQDKMSNLVLVALRIHILEVNLCEYYYLDC